MPTVAELRERAKALKMKGVSKLKKANLEKRITNREAANAREGAARGTRAAARPEEMRRSLSNEKARADWLRRTVYDPVTKRRVLRNGEAGKRLGGVQTRAMRADIPPRKRSPLVAMNVDPRTAARRTTATRAVPIRERVRRIEEAAMIPLSNANMAIVPSSRKGKVASAARVPLPTSNARTNARNVAASAASSIASAKSAKTPASASSRASVAAPRASVRSSSSSAAARSNAATRSNAASSKPTAQKMTSSEKRLVSAVARKSPKGFGRAMTGSYPVVKNSAKGGSGPAKVAPFVRKYESERKIINALGTGGRAVAKKAASARQWKDISGGIPAPYFSASAAAGKVSPSRMGKSCGIFDDRLSRLALPVMSLHSAEFKSRFDSAMSQLISPQIAVLEEYVKKGELACGAPQLRGTCAPHQLVAFQLARLFASADPSSLGGHRGAFFWHSTGSGKTTTVAAVMAAFYGTGHRVVLSTTLENKQNNSPREFARIFIEFFPGFVRRVVGKALDKTDANVKMLADRLFDNNTGASKPFVIQTLEELENALHAGKFQKYERIHADVARGQRDGGNFSKGTCLILDETQNVFMSQYKRVAEVLTSRQVVEGRGSPMPFGDRPVKTFALTATPGGNVEDFLKLLSLVRRSDQTAPFSSPEPASQFDGLVSYVDYKPRALFAKINGPTGVGVELPALYYAIALQKFKGANSGALGDFRLAKQAGGFLSKTDAGAFWDDLRKSHGVLEVSVPGGRTVVASPKLLEIARRATSMPGKQYVYFQTKASADAFCGVLRFMGFQGIGARNGIPKTAGKRFVQYHATGADKPASTLRSFVAVMRAKENLHGEVCKIIVAHGKNYEGLNIPALRGVHLGEPLFSSFADKQAIGRGARFCGHAGLAGEALIVTVFRYFSEPPKSLGFADVFPGKTGKRWETKYAKMMNSVSNVDRAAAAKGMSAVRREHPGIDARGYDAMAHAAAGAPQVLVRFEESVKSRAVDRDVMKYFASSKREAPAAAPAPPRARSVPRSLSAALVSAGKRRENANLANAMKRLVIKN